VRVQPCGTQEGYWRARASYEAIEQALRHMRESADKNRIRSIAIPRIGVGYGGLSWKKVRAIIEKVFGDWRARRRSPSNLLDARWRRRSCKRQSCGPGNSVNGSS